MRNRWLFGAGPLSDPYNPFLPDLTVEGIPAGSIGIPTRNIHSCVAVLDLEDVEKTVEWLSQSFKTFKDYFK